MNIDIEELKHIDWWNDKHHKFGKVTVDIEDTDLNRLYDFTKNPWDIAYHNITQNLYGSFTIAMQIQYDDKSDRTQPHKITQKVRSVTISYDPHFPQIVDDEIKPKKGKRK